MLSGQYKEQYLAATLKRQHDMAKLNEFKLFKLRSIKAENDMLATGWSRCQYSYENVYADSL